MEFEELDLTEIEKLSGEHALVIISNGQIKWAKLPIYGAVEIISNDSKVKYVEERIKKTF